jgi:hypothetical protein
MEKSKARTQGGLGSLMRSMAHRSLALSTVYSGILCIFASFLPAQERHDTDMASTVLQVQKNIAALRAKLPNFVCKEQIDMQEVADGKVVKTGQHVSTLVAVRRRQGESDSGFAESREDISATENGKQVKAEGYVPPFGVRGGFAEDLFQSFDESRGKCYDFNLAGREEVRGRTALVVNIQSKADDQKLGPQCAHVAARSTAKVWIDAESLQVVRLQKPTAKSLWFQGPFAKTNGEYLGTSVIEYAPVIINDVKYWLPAEKRVEFVKTKGQRSFAYQIEYSDFHKFDTSIKIVSADLESH